VISNPTRGSASGNPASTPIAPTTTASEVNPSVRACKPSATRAADPILRPTRIRYTATSSLPAKPIRPAAMTTHTYVTGCGLSSRRLRPLGPRGTDCRTKLDHAKLATVMLRHATPGVLRVKNRILDQRPHVGALDPVEHLRSCSTGPHQPAHPQLGQMLRNRSGRLADRLGQLVDRQLTIK